MNKVHHLFVCMTVADILFATCCAESHVSEYTCTVCVFAKMFCCSTVQPSVLKSIEKWTKCHLFCMSVPHHFKK